MQNEKAVIILTVLFLVILIAVAVVFAGYYTDWYKTKFSTFYVTDGNAKLFADAEESRSLKNVRFGVTYDFVKDKAYTVKVLPTGEDFAFTVDGIVLAWSELDDVTTAFDIAQSDKSFSIRCKDVTIKQVLSRLFLESTIEVDEEVDITAHYKLVVESADGKHSVAMTFKCYHSVKGVGFDTPDVAL